MLSRILATGFLLLAAETTVPAREWTNTVGKTITADIVSANKTSVTLKMPDGSLPVVLLSTLSQGDQDFVKDWLKEQASTPKPVTPPKDTKTATDSGKDALQCTGFEGEWPDDARVPDELNIEIVKEDDDEKEYIYRSTHFEFQSNVQLKKRLVSACAKVFEATHEYLRLLPLNHISTNPQKKPFPVELFETKEQYFAAGGMAGSAGVCIWDGGESKVLVPLASFGVRKSGKDYTVDPKAGDWHVLSHEITHQLMSNEVKEATWYTEGSAEYVGCTPYTGGRFKISTNRLAILAYMTDYGRDGSGGRALGKDIKMTDLKSFMSMPQSSFLKSPNTNYGLGCLLTYYFYHLDGKGDAARMKAYLKELQSGTKEPQAREKLLDGRTYTEVGEDFAKGMRKYGIKIKCEKSVEPKEEEAEAGDAR